MIGLSTSALSVFRDCARCFWLEKNRKIKRPRGIFPSLPKGMDRVMKEQVEEVIRTGGQVPALLTINGAQPFSDRERIEKFRSWRTFQRNLQIGAQTVTVWGELDDLIEHLETGLVSPWDYKTKGTEPDENYGKLYYENQLDTYHFLLEGQDLKCTGKGYLSYGWPIQIRDQVVIFGWKNLIMDTVPDRAVAIVTMAVECLMGPEPHVGSPSCEYCNYVAARIPLPPIMEDESDIPVKLPARKKKGAKA